MAMPFGRASTGLVVWLLVLGATGPARADMWERAGRVERSQEAVNDPSGFTYRGRTNFVPPPGGGGPIVDLGGDLSKGCSAFDFASSFKALFDANALERYTTGLATSALSSAPVVLLCYMSPTLCDAYKHLKALSQAQLAANQAACESVQTAAEGFGRSMRNTAVKACLDQKAAAGVPLHVAVEECSRLDPGQAILDLKGLPIGRGSYSVVEKALETTGASPGLIALAKQVTGQVSFTASGTGGTARIQPPPPGGAMATYQDYFTESQTELSVLVQQAAAGHAPTPSSLQRLGGFGVVVTPRLIAAISQLPPGRRELAVEKMAAALARIRLETELREVKAQLQSVAIGERGGHRELLQQLVTQIDDQLRQVNEIEAAQHAIAAPAEAIFQEAAAEGARARRIAAPDLTPQPGLTSFGGARGKETP